MIFREQLVAPVFRELSDFLSFMGGRFGVFDRLRGDVRYQWFFRRGGDGVFW